MNEREAREALAGLGAAQGRLAEAMTCPPWRHAAFGAIMAAFVGEALPITQQMVATTATLAATVALAAHDRRRMGVFVNGYRKGGTRVVALVLLGVMLSLVFAEVHLRTSDGATLSKIAIALIAGGFAIVASIVWQRVYVRELTRGQR